MTQNLRLLIGSVLTSSLLSLNAAGDETSLNLGTTPLAADVNYRDGAGRVARLSNEDQIPYQLPRHVPRFDYVMKAVDAAIKRFPSVRECLKEDQRNAQQPDLTQFDWQQLGKRGYAAVCLFRIATSYKARADVVRWFQIQRFRTRTNLAPNGDVTIIANWPMKQFPVPIPVETYPMLHGRIADNVMEKAVITFSADGNEVSIDRVFKFIYWD